MKKRVKIIKFAVKSTTFTKVRISHNIVPYFNFKVAKDSFSRNALCIYYAC